MAEAMFRRLAEERGVEAEVRSAGIAALPGAPMSEQAAEVLRARGIETPDFRSTELDEELVKWADLILTMTVRHKSYLIGRFPDAVEKTHTLKEFAVSDPETAALIRERESLAAELQLKLALGQPVTEEEREKLLELERKLPDSDVDDPIGGGKERYEAAAAEIETAVRAVLDRLYSESRMSYDENA